MELKKNKIVACLDVSGGMLVKGVKFGDLKSIKDPVEAGLNYAKAGVDELVYYDISATVEDRGIFEKPIVELSKRITIPFTVGGGIKTIDDIKRVLKLGADKVSINSAAVNNPEIITEASRMFGSGRIVASMDVMKEGDSWKVYLGAGKIPTDLDAIEWAIKLEELGAGELCVNSIDNDGVKGGFDLELMEKISSAVRIPTVASGGAGEYQDFIDAFEAGSASALGASVFHFGILDIGKLKEKIIEYTTGKLKYDNLGLIPVIVQDALNKKVLMQAYMNRESLEKTIETGSSWFYSRSRQELWEKGATSGNTQSVVSLSADCDYDSILMEVLPDGPACHTGEVSCYYNEIKKFSDSVNRNILFEEFDIIKDRVINPKQGSYTDYLLGEGVDKICKKIGEEAAETIIAAKNDSKEELIYEAADLLYHLNVLLVEKGVELDDIMREITKRVSNS